MSSLPTELTPTAAAATGAATVALIIGVPMICKGVQNCAEAFKNWREGYSKNEMDEFNKIKKIYKTHCLRNNSAHVSLANISKSMIGTSEYDKDFPIYFQMDAQYPTKPRFYSDGYHPELSADEWARCIGSNGDELINAYDGIKDLISWICNYQDSRQEWARYKFVIAGKGYYYDPTNIFFEEFKSWLITLSNTKVSPKTLTDIECRMNYLHDIEAAGLFDKQSSRTQTRRTTVLGLEKRLKGLYKHAENILLLKAAREDFKALADNIAALIRETTAFCFYIFRDTKNLPKSWDMGAVRMPEGNYQQAVENTRSGKLLQNLLSSEISSFANNDTNDEEIGTARECKLFSENSKDLLFNLEDKELKKLEWGILPDFRDNNILKKFFRLHRLVEKLMEFKIVVKQLYKLSGKGGDMLVCGELSAKTKETLNYYRGMSYDLEQLIRDLYKIAYDKKMSLVYNKDANKSEEIWLQSFTIADTILAKICNRYDNHYLSDSEVLTINSRDIVEKIHNRIEKISNPDYMMRFEAELNKFTTWAELFIEAALPSTAIIKMDSDTAQEDDPQDKAETADIKASKPKPKTKLFSKRHSVGLWRKKPATPNSLEKKDIEVDSNKALPIIPPHQTTANNEASARANLNRSSKNLHSLINNLNETVASEDQPKKSTSAEQAPEYKTSFTDISERKMQELEVSAQQDFQRSQDKTLLISAAIDLLTQAKGKIENLLEIKPHEAKYLFLMAKYISSSGTDKDRRFSLSLYQDALTYCEPQNEELYCKILYEYGFTLNRLFGSIKPRDALVVFDEVLQRQPHHFQARLIRAEIYGYRLNEEVKAMDDFSTIINNPNASNEIKLLALRGRRDLASNLAKSLKEKLKLSCSNLDIKAIMKIIAECNQISLADALMLGDTKQQASELLTKINEHRCNSAQDQQKITTLEQRTQTFHFGRV